jgi:uncharacterized protein
MTSMNKKIGLALALAALAAPLAGKTSSGSASFLKAVRERDGDTIAKMVSEPGSVVVNTRDRSTGEGALHLIVRNRDYTWLAFLLGRGARPDLQSNSGATALSLAAPAGWRARSTFWRARRASTWPTAAVRLR